VAKAKSKGRNYSISEKLTGRMRTGVNGIAAEGSMCFRNTLKLRKPSKVIATSRIESDLIRPKF
jgi:hypothetical protein